MVKQPKVEVLLISDLHLTDKPQDEYKWDLFPQVKRLLIERSIKEIIILGDLCDLKDNHSGVLVNRIVEGIQEWKQLAEIKLLRGNHDGLGEQAYFQFLSHFPGIEYFDRPYCVGNEVYLPHSRNPLEAWRDIDLVGRVVYVHATVQNVLTEGGFRLTDSDLEADYFGQSAITFAGDIHKPQQLGKVIYVGAPYNTRFGDDFDGGCIVLDYHALKWERVPFSFPRKFVFDVCSVQEWRDQADLREGTPAQVRIRLHVGRRHQNLDTWQRIRQEILEDLAGRSNFSFAGFDLVRVREEITLTRVDHGSTQQSDMDRFCALNQIDGALRDTGLEILKEFEQNAQQKSA